MVFSITGSNPGWNTDSNHLRIANVINGNGFWTVSFDIKGIQSVALPVKVDICDLGRTQFYTNAIQHLRAQIADCECYQLLKQYLQLC